MTFTATCEEFTSFLVNKEANLSKFTQLVSTLDEKHQQVAALQETADSITEHVKQLNKLNDAAAVLTDERTVTTQVIFS